MLVGDAFRAGNLKLFRGACPETLRELSFYRWDTDKDKEGAKELTLGDDHCMDALRYAIMSRPAPHSRIFATPPDSFAAEMRKRLRERQRLAWPTGAYG